MDLSWLPDDGGTGHMPPSTEVINFWKKVKEITNFKTLVEIGFNAGHSSAIMLSLFDDIKIQSYDIGQFDITEKNGIIVRNRFPNRFELTIKDSTTIEPKELNGADILFIDGGHDIDIVRVDALTFLKTDIKYCVLDDMQNDGVKEAYRRYLEPKTNKLHYEKYQAVLPSWMRNTNRKSVTVPVFLLEKK